MIAAVASLIAYACILIPFIVFLYDKQIEWCVCDGWRRSVLVFVIT